MRLTLYDFLRIGHIKRWHNVNVAREQTVGEHSFMVMLIALHLYAKMVGCPKADNDPWRELSVLLIGAMFHDAPEAAGGDTPTPAKRLIREITGDPDIFDKLDKFLMPELPYIGGPAPMGELGKMIKMADAIEGYHFIYNNGVGTHAEIVKMGARRRLEDLALKYDEQAPDWIPAINEVLTAMGLPYVHKESRISPP